jgi:LAGLIDADG endonuclease
LIIIDHFDNYPLISKKQADFKLFKAVIQLMCSKEHLVEEGLHKIISIRASLNNGLSDKLKTSFPKTVPVNKPLVKDTEIKDVQWLIGFTTGEGCFLIDTYKAKTKVGIGVTLRFKIAQHSRDADLLKSFVTFLGCGSYVPKSSYDVGEFVVSKFEDNISKIIPLFEKYPVLGVKSKDFIDFKNAAELIKNKAHLEESGLAKILSIKSGMNRGR